MIATLVLLPTTVLAQDTGTIIGRVENTVSGDSLNLAKVKVQGTNREVFTNEFGEYRLTGLPAGEVILVVSYTGLISRTVAVEVMAGGTVTNDVSLTTSRMTSVTRDDDTVVMDAFTVASERDTNAASIAANEQRYSGNLKSVVSADAFGDVTEGNIGEFMKFLPGISVDYVAADVRTMAVRGFADNFTSISVNGARMASSASGGASRSFEFEQVSINNVARIEVSKAPTPSMPADSLGGAVNMVSKSAFERKGAQFKYKVYVSANSEALDLTKKTPGPMNKPTAKVLPGFDFDYTLPISDTFGIVVTGLVSNQYNEQHRSQKLWSFAQAGATATNPYLQQYLFQDGPKNTFRRSGSVKADWKITPGSVLSASLQSNYYLSQFGNRNYTYNVGTSASSTPSGGAALSYGPDFTHGADGRGSVRGQTSFRDKYGATTAGNVNWNYKADTWEVDASVNASKSRTWYRDTGRGHFSEVRSSLLGAKRIDFDGINDAGISNVTIFDAAGNVLDPTLYSNYRVEYGRGNPIDAYDKFVGGNVNFKYNLDLSFPAAIKVGADRRVQTRDIRKWDESWQLAGTVTGAAYTDNSFSFQDPGFGLRNQQYPDAYALYSLLQNDSAKFAQTTSQALAAERFRRQNSQRLKETISAGYLQAEAKLMEGRLGLITGVRYEKTEDEGVGPLTKGPITTMALLQANFLERAYKATGSYDGYYPSFHANYEINDNMVARFAYSTSLGRPDFSNILPLARVNDTGTSVNDGIGNVPAMTVIVTNTNLLPWNAKSYDLSLENYFTKGGVISAGVFTKTINDFWGNSTGTVGQAEIDQYNLDASTLGLDLQSKYNVGEAKISGFEFNYQQALYFLPGIGKDFNIFANATKLRLKGANDADFSKFIEKSASWGVTYSHKPVVLSLKWNYRGRQRLRAQTGSGYGGAAGGFREYYAPRIFTDINVEYQFNKRFTAFANARNILNVPQILERYNDVSPDYSHQYRQEEFGVQIALGVKGTF